MDTTPLFELNRNDGGVDAHCEVWEGLFAVTKENEPCRKTTVHSRAVHATPWDTAEQDKRKPREGERRWEHGA